MRTKFVLLLVMLAIALAVVGGAIAFVVIREPSRPVAPATDAPAPPAATPHTSKDF